MLIRLQAASHCHKPFCARISFFADVHVLHLLHNYGMRYRQLMGQHLFQRVSGLNRIRCIQPHGCHIGSRGE